MLWLRTTGPERKHLQGLIQLAAACVHLEKGRPAPARRLLSLALEKLETVPQKLHGVPVEALRTAASSLGTRLASGPFPAAPLRLLSPLPPPRTE